MKADKILGIVSGAVLAAGLALGVTGSATAAGADGAEPASNAPIDARECWIKLADQAQLASDRPGVIASLPEEGDRVTRYVMRDGENVQTPVATLRAEVAEAALAAAEIEAKNDIAERFAEKAHELAKAELEKSLYVNRRARGTIPDIELKRQELEIQKAKLQIEKEQLTQDINKKKRDQAAAELNTYYVYAPFDGTVRQVYKNVGEAVRQGDPLLDIINTDRVYVTGYVTYYERQQVQVGNLVGVSLAETSQDESFATGIRRKNPELPGKIVFIDEVADPASRMIRIKAEVDNREHKLIAGLPARMMIYPGRTLEDKSTAAVEK